jgi:hypothetical protein
MSKTLLGPPRPLISTTIHRFDGDDVYRPGQVNFCPSCGRRHWHVGRASCECGHCGAVVPLAQNRIDLICKVGKARRLASWREIARRLQERRGD